MADRLQPVIRSVLAVPRPPDTPAGIGDLSLWTPADPALFAIDITFYIGDVDDPPGVSDSFETLVCSPAWLANNLSSLQTDEPDEPDLQSGLGYRTGRGLWMAARWDPAALEGDISALLADAAGPNWPFVANRLSRHLDWEYDYRFDGAIAEAPPELT